MQALRSSGFLKFRIFTHADAELLKLAMTLIRQGAQAIVPKLL